MSAGDHRLYVGDHRLYESKTLMNASVGVWRYRLFCSCGWVSDPVGYETEVARLTVEHLATTVAR